MADSAEVCIQLYRDDRDGGGGYDYPESDHRYGADIDALIDELAGGADKLNRRAEPPSTDISRGARIELHENGPEIIALIQAGAAVIAALTPLLVAWIQKPSREIIVIHAGNEVARGSLTPHEVQQTLEQLAGQR